MVDINDIKQVFEDAWGEDRVDLQRGNGFGLFVIWYPEATVTNENGDSIDIRDLYFFLKILNTGHLDWIKATRTTYTSEQFSAYYIHSHIYPGSLNSTELHDICAGTSPFYYTLRGLENDPVLSDYELMTSELDSFVAVESLNGGPWVRMQTVRGSDSRGREFLTYQTQLDYNSPAILMDNEYKTALSFIYYLFQYHTEGFVIHNGIIELWRTGYFLCEWLSQCFEDWQDKYLVKTGLIPLAHWTQDCTKAGSSYYNSSQQNLDLITEPMLVFKGEPKYLRVTDGEDSEVHKILRLPYVVWVYQMTRTLLNTDLNIKNPIRWLD